MPLILLGFAFVCLVGHFLLWELLMPSPNDTSPEADQVLTGIYRTMSPARKWQRLGAMYRRARSLHVTAVHLDRPGATDEDIRRDWLTRVHPEIELPRMFQGLSMATQDEALQVVAEVAGVFTRLGVVYALGGSLASSLRGVPRFTEDADVTAEPFPGKEADFVAAFGPDYYLSEPAVRQAVQQRSSFNLIHTPSGFKVDVFVRKDRPFEQSLLSRRQALVTATSPPQQLDVVTAEDIILLKLEWYRLGQETSDRQWSDILGVLKVQAGQLDDGYLDSWAAQLGVADLLARARAEAKGSLPN